MGGPHNLSRPAEVADVLLFGLLLAAIPFVLPIASWVAARRTRSRVEELSRTISEQQSAIEKLSVQIAQLKREARTAEESSPDAATRPSDTGVPAAVSPAVHAGCTIVDACHASRPRDLRCHRRPSATA